MAGPFTLEETARRLGHYRWVEMRLFEVMGGWVASVPEAEVKVHLGAHAQAHGWHATLWRDLMPATAQLNPDDLTGPSHESVAAFMDAVAGAGAGYQTIEKLVGLYRVLLPRKISAYTRHLDASTPVADAPLVRAFGFVLQDEFEDWRRGEALLQSLLVTVGAVERAAAWQAQLEILLTPFGGIVKNDPEGV